MKKLSTKWILSLILLTFSVTGCESLSPYMSGISKSAKVQGGPGYCGDRIVQPYRGEECEGTSIVSCVVNGYAGYKSCQRTCNYSECKSTESCGDLILQSKAGEQCDDGNTFNGDGCSATCQKEVAKVKIDQPAEPPSQSWWETTEEPTNVPSALIGDRVGNAVNYNSGWTENPNERQYVGVQPALHYDDRQQWVTPYGFTSIMRLPQQSQTGQTTISDTQPRTAGSTLLQTK